MMNMDGLASRMIDACEVGTPIDPWLMAARAGYEVRIGIPKFPAMTLGPSIVVPDHRVERRAFAVLHELAHATLRNIGERDDEKTVDALASATLLPRATIVDQLLTLGPDVFALKARHPNASHEAIARRVVSLTGGALVVHDRSPNGARSRTSGSVKREVARKLILDAHASGEVVGNDEARAYPVRDGAWSRVLLVAQRARSR